MYWLEDECLKPRNNIRERWKGFLQSSKLVTTIEEKRVILTRQLPTQDKSQKDIQRKNYYVDVISQTRPNTDTNQTNLPLLEQVHERFAVECVEVVKLSDVTGREARGVVGHEGKPRLFQCQQRGQVQMARQLAVCGAQQTVKGRQW